MKRLLCLCLCAISGFAGFSQVRFNSIFETGISLPVGAKAGSALHNSSGISIGNHMDLSFGDRAFFWGIGGYIGNINANGVNDKFKETGMLIARKYQLQPSQLVFNSSSFHSTQFLVGPVAGVNCHNFNMRIWAKGGFGIANPARYSVAYREGSTEQKIYVSNASDNKNGLSYDLGAGFYYLMTNNLGLQLSGSYNNTRTNQVNYSYEQEKGTLPSYVTANNSFIKASIGLVVNIGTSQSRTGGRTYTGGRRNAREAGSGMATGRRAINTSRSNIKSPSREAEATVKSPRDAASGLATGRRMHKPIVITIDAEDNEQVVIAPRDAASGLATGRRMHKPIVITIDAEDNEQAVVAPRDAASGLATGRRMHKPIVITIDAEDNEQAVIAPRDAASGLATGKRMHKPVVIRIDEEDNGPAVYTLRGQNNNTVRSNRGGYITVLVNPGNGEDSTAAAIGENPLYNPSGNSGQNPMHEAKGIQEKGIKRSEEKGIQENGLIADKGINQAGVQKTVNTSRGNIKRVQNINCKGDDCDVEIVLEVDGEEYTVVLKGGRKTKRRVEVLKSN